MKTIYYFIVDVTRYCNDPEQTNFFTAKPMEDISKKMIEISKRNNTPIENIKLYICPDKETFEREQKEVNELLKQR